MQSYDESSKQFKLITGSEIGELPRHILRIFGQILGNIGVPVKFYECVKALYVTGNWSEIKDFEAIPIKRMARNMSAKEGVNFKRAYERISRNLPKFFAWQEQEQIAFFTVQKTGQQQPNKYKFNYYKEVQEIMEMDVSTYQVEISRLTAKLADKIRSHKLEVKERPKRAKPEYTKTLKIAHLWAETAPQMGSVDFTINLVSSFDSTTLEPSNILEVARNLVSIYELKVKS